MKYGVDISSWQPTIDYDELSKNISFAILRVGYGVEYLPNSQKDRMLDKHYEGLYGKVPIGMYYYQYANEVGEGKKEAENCLKYLNGRKIDLPIYYDVEDSSLNGIDKSKLASIVKEFCQTIKDAGYNTGIYACKHWLENKLNLDELPYPIWAAAYGKNDGNVPEASYKYLKAHDMWQYTSRGYVSGITGKVDLNILYNDINVSKNENVTPEKVYSGDETIKKIQATLNSDYNSGLVVDGYYGKNTKKALIKALQHEYNVQYKSNINEDGIFGPITKTNTKNVTFGAKGKITYLIQCMLYFKGYNTNGVDGIFGKGTIIAVRKFQSNQRLAVDGIVGKNTFEALFK